MKTLIIALNSKYIHSALAPWYLKAAAGDLYGEIKVVEFTINENPESVLASIYAEKAEVAAFSCYIWNIGQVLRIAENLKKVSPHTTVVFGGPEVSYNPVELLCRYCFIDYVISGEGEKPFPGLLKSLYQEFAEPPSTNKLLYAGEYRSIGDQCQMSNVLLGNSTETYAVNKGIGCSGKLSDGLKEIAGLTYRSDGAIESNPADMPPNLSDIPSPYTEEMLSVIKDKIAYFEASRGCPFSCSYCLSSASEGVRFFPMARVKNELAAVVKAGVRQVKFVDRTFNCNKERAKELLRFVSGLQQSKGKTPANFHFEAAADLFDEELINMLVEMPRGLIQLEIGIQTVNPDTLEAVRRKTDIRKAFENINRILQAGNIHLHLDLIAGLPFEDFKSFKESFDKVYSLKPHTLQLGFLKMLKGSSIRAGSLQHGYVFRDYAPYEVLSSRYISYEELTVLKGMEELLDRYWNSGRFILTLGYIIDNYFASPSDFFLGFYKFNLEMNRNIQSVSGRDLIFLLLEYAKTVKCIDITRLKEYLKLDFLASESSGHLPAGLDGVLSRGFVDKCHDFLKDQSKLAAYLPSFIGVPAKQIMKNVHFEEIIIDEYEKTMNTMRALEIKDAIKTEETVDNTDKQSSVYLFDYSARDAVTGRYNFFLINNF